MSVEYFYKLPHILSNSVKLIVDQCHIYSPLASVPAATLQSHHRQQRSLGRGCHKLRNSNAFTLGLGPEVPPPLHPGQLQGGQLRGRGRGGGVSQEHCSSVSISVCPGGETSPSSEHRRPQVACTCTAFRRWLRGVVSTRHSSRVLLLLLLLLLLMIV